LSAANERLDVADFSRSMKGAIRDVPMHGNVAAAYLLEEDAPRGARRRGALVFATAGRSLSAIAFAAGILKIPA
jgi:hypothetical protein